MHPCRVYRWCCYQWRWPEKGGGGGRAAGGIVSLVYSAPFPVLRFFRITLGPTLRGEGAVCVAELAAAGSPFGVTPFGCTLCTTGRFNASCFPVASVLRDSVCIGLRFGRVGNRGRVNSPCSQCNHASEVRERLCLMRRLRQLRQLLMMILLHRFWL